MFGTFLQKLASLVRPMILWEGVLVSERNWVVPFV